MPWPPRVSAFMGSPRLKANTDTLVEAVLEGAAMAGALTEKVVLAHRRILPCLGCGTCKRVGACVHSDDMPALISAMRASQVWVLGTPVYWWGPTAQFKAFMDRWYGADSLVHPQGTYAILAVTLADTDQATARHTLGMLQDALSYLGAEVAGAVVATGTSEPGDILAQPGVLEEARRLGHTTVDRVRRGPRAAGGES